MYLALGFIPWLVIYAASTIVMNHRDFFLNENTSGQAQASHITIDREYHPNFSAYADIDTKVQQILKDLGMEGGYYVSPRSQPEQLVIYRESPGHERKIIYFPGKNRLVVEESDFRLRGFMTGLHTRYGFGGPYMGSNLWAVLVDLVSIAMVIWVASGIYMWWELQKTRFWGALTLAGGMVVFAALLVVL